MPGERPFYDMLADFYDLLFPVTADQQRFFGDLVAQHKVRRVLDVACGSGGQAAMFHELGLEVSALEDNARMVELARAKWAGIRVRLGSMEDVAVLFEPGYGLVLCIGNSLAHLGDLQAVRRTIAGMRSLLRPGGILVLSIVNFDIIAEKRIVTLPSKAVWDAQGRRITFERFYDLSLLPERVTFSFNLDVAGEEHASSVWLIPISPAWLTGVVAGMGMTVLDRFAAFDHSPFTAESASLVLVARAD
jgi:glycine/sarcosine N-methyltransferase